MIALVLLLVVLPAARPASFKIPSYVKDRCLRNDPNLNKCALEKGRQILPNIINGDPNVKLMPLDPLLIDKIVMKPTGNTRSVGLVMSCNKCKLTGLRNAQLTDVNINLKDNTFQMKAYIPKFEITGTLEANGKVLILPVVGKGKGSIIAEGVDIDVLLMTELAKRGSETYLTFKDYKIKFNMKRLTMDTKNLFSDNKQLGDNISRFLNENWQEVLKDVQPAISDTIGQIAQSILATVFNNIPYDVILPESLP